MPRADWNYVSEVPFDLPQQAEQERIASVLDAADHEISLLTKEVVKLREQKIGLMQQLLTGNIRVKS